MKQSLITALDGLEKDDVVKYRDWDIASPLIKLRKIIRLQKGSASIKVIRELITQFA